MTKRSALPIRVVALDLGVSERHVYNLLKANLLKAIDISISGESGPLSLRITRDSLEKFKQSRIYDPTKKEAIPD